MGDFFQQVSKLLTISPGSLIYHLVLTFSLTGALVFILNRRNTVRLPADSRAAIALGIMLALRVVLFILAGFFWQGLINEHLILPPLDRAIALLSVVLIGWMWAYPQPNRLADAGVWLLGLITVLLYVFSMVWWVEQGSTSNYDGTWADLTTQTSAVFILLVGILILLIRKPNGWGNGLSMLVLLLAGYVIYLIQLPIDSDFAAAVRVSQLVAYPLLLGLSLRFTATQPARKFSPPFAPRQPSNPSIDSDLLQNILALGTETEPDKLCKNITRTVASAVPAEICLLISVPDESDHFTVYCGHDLVRERHMDGFTTSGKRIPVIAASIRKGTPQALSPGSASPDLATLAASINLNQAGHLLFSPINDSEGKSLAGLILLSPYSKRGWTGEEQAILQRFSQPLAQLLHHTQMLAGLQLELEHTRQALQEAQAQLEQAESIEENLPLTELGWAEVGAVAAIYDTQHNQSFEASESEYIEGELRLALEELARLKGALSDADQQMLDLKNQMDGRHLSGEQNQTLTLTIQELRQSMSAVVGYTDFLLGESVGILGTLQRKFLERIRISTERINRLVDDLSQVTSVKNGRHLIRFEPVDLNAAIVEAIANTSDQLQEKGIALKLDLPDELPQIHTDQVALQQILTYLLENAGEVTPANEEISLRAILQGDERDRTFYLIQVSDKGGGVATADIPRLFVRIPRGDIASTPGVSTENNNLYIVNRIVDTLGGRIWVDSQTGIGSTFSILLPIEPEFQTLDETGDLAG